MQAAHDPDWDELEAGVEERADRAAGAEGKRTAVGDRAQPKKTLKKQLGVVEKGSSIDPSLASEAVAERDPAIAGEVSEASGSKHVYEEDAAGEEALLGEIEAEADAGDGEDTSAEEDRASKHAAAKER